MQTKLFEAMLRHGIGLDPWFFERNAEAPNFPPHQIVQLDDNHYELTLAVAGYQAEEMQIILEADMLTIIGHKEEEADDSRQVLYRGIAFRDFTRQFKIGENVEVQDVTLKHGLLTIELVREVPEFLKPKQIPISS